MPSYVKCPYCHREYVRLRVDNCMRMHRTNFGFISKGTLFPYCPYSGCTIEETLQGKTSLLKRREEYERRGGLAGAEERFKKRQGRLKKKDV